jgi:hypothetical protein
VSGRSEPGLLTSSVVGVRMAASWLLDGYDDCPLLSGSCGEPCSAPMSTAGRRGALRATSTQLQHDSMGHTSISALRRSEGRVVTSGQGSAVGAIVSSLVSLDLTCLALLDLHS